MPILKRKGHPLSRMSSATIAGRINNARNMNLQELEPQQIRERIRRIMDGYLTVVLPLRLNGVFRARKNPDQALFENVNQLWYPPAHLVLRPGRFNHINESVFYASSTMQGAVFEVRPEVGDIITLLVSRTRNEHVDLSCSQIGLERSLAPEVADVRKSGRLPQNHPRLQALLRKHQISNKWLRVDRFLTELATTVFPPEIEAKGYVMTTTISDVLFRPPYVNAFNYPSVATTLKSINLCLKPDMADQTFIPVEAWMIRIDDETTSLPGASPDAGNRFFRTTYLRRSEEIGSDGTIRWSSVLGNIEPYEIAYLVR